MLCTCYIHLSTVLILILEKRIQSACWLSGWIWFSISSRSSKSATIRWRCTVMFWYWLSLSSEFLVESVPNRTKAISSLVSAKTCEMINRRRFQPRLKVKHSLGSFVCALFWFCLPGAGQTSEWLFWQVQMEVLPLGQSWTWRSPRPCTAPTQTTLNKHVRFYFREHFKLKVKHLLKRDKSCSHSWLHDLLNCWVSSCNVCLSIVESYTVSYVFYCWVLCIFFIILFT